MAERVFDELRRYNDQFEPKVNYHQKTFYIEEDGEFVGGLEGFVAWDVFEISNIVVLKKGKGYGTALIQKAEKFARDNKANKIVAWTLGFQAPGFYRKCDFEEVSVVENFAGEHSCHYFMKRL